MIGDGAGIGKGRTLAAVVLHNFNGDDTLSKLKHIWVSTSADLLYDAQRDLDALGKKHPVANPVLTHRIGVCNTKP